MAKHQEHYGHNGYIEMPFELEFSESGFISTDFKLSKNVYY